MTFAKEAAFSSLLLVATSNALASESADLTLTGKITPAACDVSFSEGGEVDFGRINAKNLNTDQRTTLPAKSIAYSISCDMNAKIGTVWMDNRGNGSGHEFSLGQQGSKSIGTYTVAQVSSKLQVNDGTGAAPGVLLESDNAGNTWTVKSGNAEQVPGQRRIQSHGLTGNTAPADVQAVTGEFEITPTISPTQDLDLNNKVELQGSATLSISYL